MGRKQESVKEQGFLNFQRRLFFYDTANARPFGPALS